MADILETALTGTKKTQIMYKANLSYKLLQKYLHRLTEEELLALRDEKYYTTEKGKAFIETYNELGSPKVKIGAKKPAGPLTAEFIETYKRLLKPIESES